MTAADTLLSLANALRKFNDSLPDNPSAMSYYSYMEDNNLGRSVLSIPLKEGDILDVQIDIELTKEQFRSIASLVTAELETLNDWYEKHLHEIRDIRNTIVFRELKEERERIDDDFASRLDEARIREKVFSDLHQACYGIDPSVRRLSDIRNRKMREYIKPYYERMIECTSYPDYNLQELQNDVNVSALQRESVIEQRDEMYRVAEREARKRVNQTDYNIYHDVVAYMEPIAEFLTEKTESAIKETRIEETPARRKGRPGTPKEIDTIEKCFASNNDCEVFISTIREYIKQGNSFTGSNCSNAYAFLTRYNLLHEELRSKSIFAELLHKQYESLYPRSDSRSIAGKLGVWDDGFVAMLKLHFKFE